MLISAKRIEIKGHIFFTYTTEIYDHYKGIDDSFQSYIKKNFNKLKNTFNFNYDVLKNGDYGYSLYYDKKHYYLARMEKIYPYSRPYIHIHIVIFDTKNFSKIYKNRMLDNMENIFFNYDHFIMLSKNKSIDSYVKWNFYSYKRYDYLVSKKEHIIRILNGIILNQNKLYVKDQILAISIIKNLLSIIPYDFNFSINFPVANGKKHDLILLGIMGPIIEYEHQKIVDLILNKDDLFNNLYELSNIEYFDYIKLINKYYDDDVIKAFLNLCINMNKMFDIYNFLKILDKLSFVEKLEYINIIIDNIDNTIFDVEKEYINKYIENIYLKRDHYSNINIDKIKAYYLNNIKILNVKMHEPLITSKKINYFISNIYNPLLDNKTYYIYSYSNMFFKWLNNIDINDINIINTLTETNKFIHVLMNDKEFKLELQNYLNIHNIKLFLSNYYNLIKFIMNIEMNNKKDIKLLNKNLKNALNKIELNYDLQYKFLTHIYKDKNTPLKLWIDWLDYINQKEKYRIQKNIIKEISKETLW